MTTSASPFDLLLSYPQWQGSGRSAHLVRGALALTRLLEGAAPLAKVPLSDAEGDSAGVNRHRAILQQMDAAQALLARHAPSRVLTAGGDCAVDIAVIDYLVGRYPALTVVWIDSHFDANTPDTSPSGNLHGMPVAAILGAAPAEMRDRLQHPLQPAQFRYVWANVADPGDLAFQTAHGLQWLGDDDVLAGPVHVHFDLDVLNPAEFPYLAYPEKTGMPVANAIALCRRIARDADVVGLTITEFAPASDEDAAAGSATIRALYEALVT